MFLGNWRGEIILGNARISFKGAREIWALLSGSKGALTQLGEPQLYSSVSMWFKVVANVILMKAS